MATADKTDKMRLTSDGSENRCRTFWEYNKVDQFRADDLEGTF